MRTFLYAFLVVTGLLATARADTPSPSAFTAQFARALQVAMPLAKVSIVRDLQLDVRRADGTSATVSLVNNYKDYTADPKWFDAVIKACAAGMDTPSSNDEKSHSAPLTISTSPRRSRTSWASIRTGDRLICMI